MAVIKGKINIDSPDLKVSQKDLEYLTTMCNLTKQIMNKYSEDYRALTSLRIAFCVDMIVPDKIKISEIVDQDVTDAYEEFVGEVREKLYERGII